MSYCQDGSGWKHMGVLAWSGETLIPRLPFSLFPETKVHFFVWLKEQKRTESATEHFYSMSTFLSCVRRAEPWMAQAPLGSSAWQREGRRCVRE